MKTNQEIWKKFLDKLCYEIGCDEVEKIEAHYAETLQSEREKAIKEWREKELPKFYAKGTLEYECIAQQAKEEIIKEIERWAKKKWKPIIADEIKNFLAKIRNN